MASCSYDRLPQRHIHPSNRTIMHSFFFLVRLLSSSSIPIYPPIDILLDLRVVAFGHNYTYLNGMQLIELYPRYIRTKCSGVVSSRARALNHAQPRCGNLNHDLFDGNLREQQQQTAPPKKETHRDRSYWPPESSMSAIRLKSHQFECTDEVYYTQFTISLGLQKVINLFNIHYTE